jgi:hypothetical protein
MRTRALLAATLLGCACGLIARAADPPRPTAKQIEDRKRMLAAFSTMAEKNQQALRAGGGLSFGPAGNAFFDIVDTPVGAVSNGVKVWAELCDVTTQNSRVKVTPTGTFASLTGHEWAPTQCLKLHVVTAAPVVVYVFVDKDAKMKPRQILPSDKYPASKKPVVPNEEIILPTAFVLDGTSNAEKVRIAFVLDGVLDPDADDAKVLAFADELRTRGDTTRTLIIGTPPKATSANPDDVASIVLFPRTGGNTNRSGLIELEFKKKR